MTPSDVGTPIGGSNLMNRYARTVKPNSTVDPYQSAVTEAMDKYPWLKRMGVPIKLTVGKGPYMSESYDPKADENPHPGNFTIEMRNSRLINDQTSWPATIGREGMDYMARHDPVYKAHAQQFRQLMAKEPEQTQIAHNRYLKEQQQGETRSFEDFLKGAELQEFIGGKIFNMPGWRSVHYSPEQIKVLDSLKSYMWQGQQPTPVNIPAAK